MCVQIWWIYCCTLRPLVFLSMSQVLSSVHCVLVTPKRKLAGQLTITRSALHFSFEFLVEGTGGSTVFNKFQDKKESDAKSELGSVEKLKGNSDVGRGNEAGSGDALMKSQSNKIKHHRRWKITRVCSLSLSLIVSAFVCVCHRFDSTFLC